VKAALVAAAFLCAAAPARAADKLEVLEAKKDDAKPSRAERERADAKLRKRIGKPAEPVVNGWNLWTRETLVLGDDVDAETFSRFLHCHYTGQVTAVDHRLLGVLTGAARRFASPRIEIVSGFRAPKFNLMLRKKGREVARDSQHTYGHAVDFRLQGVPTAKLVEYVRSLRLGGAGFYPESAFVHADVGPVRTWAGR
jgi:hypothetical protein